MTTSEQKMMDDRIRVVEAVLAKLENAGLVERTGEKRWGYLSCKWQPSYTLTELGHALFAAGVDLRNYIKDPE
jgi:DNA-binding PadR family transcriptional regulator